jgi:hypothetical protein
VLEGETDERDDENVELVDEHQDIELNDDDELNLEDRAEEMFDERNSVDEMVVELIELDEDDDGIDETEPHEIVQFGMINEQGEVLDTLNLL